MNEKKENTVPDEDKNDEKKSDEVLNVGIDLGTSRSAISASNGSKIWIESFVGWPKDFIAQKVLGEKVLFGAEALENRLSLNISRPLEGGVIKDGSELSKTAVKELVGHLISMAKQNTNYKKIRAIVGVPPESFKFNKMAIRQLVADFADAIMVVSEPFSVAYGLGVLNNAMVIDIGAGTMDFCILRGTMPSDEEQKTILTAGDFIDEQLQAYLRERYPKADFTDHMTRRFKEEHSFVGESGKKVMVEIPVEGKPTKHDITAEIQRACESILPGLEETMLEMIAEFDPEYQEKVRNNVILAGGGSQIKGLREHIEGILKEYGPCNVQAIADPLFGGADGALQLANEMPDKYWENS